MNNLLLALLLASQQPSSDEICLRAAAYMEAGNQPLEGVKAVVEVIKNRARERKKSVCRVVKEPYQFSFYKPGTKLKDVRIPKKFLTKYERAIIMPPVVGECAIGFHHKSVKPSWTNRFRLVKKIDDHYFYC